MFVDDGMACRVDYNLHIGVRFARRKQHDLDRVVRAYAAAGRRHGLDLVRARLAADEAEIKVLGIGDDRARSPQLLHERSVNARIGLPVVVGHVRLRPDGVVALPIDHRRRIDKSHLERLGLLRAHNLVRLYPELFKPSAVVRHTNLDYRILRLCIRLAKKPEQFRLGHRVVQEFGYARIGARIAHACLSLGPQLATERMVLLHRRIRLGVVLRLDFVENRLRIKRRIPRETADDIVPLPVRELLLRQLAGMLPVFRRGQRVGEEHLLLPAGDAYLRVELEVAGAGQLVRRVVVCRAVAVLIAVAAGVDLHPVPEPRIPVGVAGAARVVEAMSVATTVNAEETCHARVHLQFGRRRNAVVRICPDVQRVRRRELRIDLVRDVHHHAAETSRDVGVQAAVLRPGIVQGLAFAAFAYVVQSVHESEHISAATTACAKAALYVLRDKMLHVCVRQAVPEAGHSLAVHF